MESDQNCESSKAKAEVLSVIEERLLLTQSILDDLEARELLPKQLAERQKIAEEKNRALRTVMESMGFI